MSYPSLVSYKKENIDGTDKMCTIFNPTGVRIWEIPERNGVVIGRDPLTNEVTAEVALKDGKRTHAWHMKGVEPVSITKPGPGFSSPDAQVWVLPSTGEKLPAVVQEFYAKAKVHEAPVEQPPIDRAVALAIHTAAAIIENGHKGPEHHRLHHFANLDYGPVHPDHRRNGDHLKVQKTDRRSLAHQGLD